MEIKDYGLKFKALSRRSKTNMLILHHTGCNKAGMDADAKTIHGWHLNNGWAGIGYGYVIRKNGQIERGRPDWAIGSHCLGNNATSIGIHLSGDFNYEEPTEAQIKSCVELCSNLCIKYNIQSKEIYGHRDKGNSDCPGKNLYNKLVGIRRLTHDAVLVKKNGR